MMTPCEQVAERIAMGESIGDLADHTARCEQCKAIVVLPTRLGATRTPIDPGLGFSARMTAGAQHRIAIRRRNRVALSVAGSAAATLVVVLAVVRTTGSAPLTTSLMAPDPVAVLLEQAVMPRPQPPVDPEHDSTHQAPTSDADLVAALVRFADTRRTMRYTARWSKIERPLVPYRHLVISLKSQEGQPQ